MREPAFWSCPPGFLAGLLAPVAAVYGWIAAWRMARPGHAPGVPVICVGNLTVGGAGKTPTAIAIAGMLHAAGRKPFLLSRGYGGSLSGPIRVDATSHRASDVGDEPLLLARAAPTIVARDRVAGAHAACAAGAGVLIMDDGLQNPSLTKTVSIVVVDGRRGIGNGKVFPAGPLRAPLDAQLARANAVLVIGEGNAGDAVIAAARSRGLAMLHGRLVPDPQALADLRGRGVLAFAGIGDPEKFFATLQDAGVEVRVRRPFPDHHRYRRIEGLDLIKQAEAQGLVLATTEKDAARLSGQGDVAALVRVVKALPVTLMVAEDSRWRDLVLERCR
jgi:tetraacyldisaccharide 4'-kinase